MVVYNHDLASLVKRLRRFKFELYKSVSANLSELSDNDVNRLRSYLEAAKAFKSWMVAQPELDLPETSPHEYEIAEEEEREEIENDDADMVITMMDLLEREMVGSQSGRRSTGLISHDAVRFDSVIAKVEAFLDNYVAVANPLDLPESAPRNGLSGAGR